MLAGLAPPPPERNWHDEKMIKMYRKSVKRKKQTVEESLFGKIGWKRLL